MNITKSLSLVWGHIFKDNEGIYLSVQHSHYVTYTVGTIILVALFKSVNFFNEKNMSDY